MLPLFSQHSFFYYNMAITETHLLDDINLELSTEKAKRRSGRLNWLNMSIRVMLWITYFCFKLKGSQRNGAFWMILGICFMLSGTNLIYQFATRKKTRGG